ncbi:calmodulin-binding protein 60 B-like isoform X1 [Panicum miliaceum]|uniref:Calmodulin-binding protein 60 B-like isoform X1 n=1 Tax=Panicum miliaceum TaxID=4540 RepID=A0A3L6QZY7_PANMI|nr:calmodulin-binding protein 60 B-like isoform X1 [Panicum miliaceum]
MAAKRLHDGYEHDGDQPDDKRMRRLPSFSTVIREAMMQRHMTNLFRFLEPLFRRVVQEELQAGLMQSPRYIERSPATPPAERPAWKLAFRTPPQLPIFTGSKIEDASGAPLEIVLVDADTGSPAALPQALRVELVPLFGDFPPDGREDWAPEEFQKRVVKEREGKRPLLTGEVGLTVREGRATVSELQFTDNSSWVRCRKFRIGVRVVPGSYDGARIQEAMTEAFVVRDHRGELYRKHYPPVLGDDVWRLEKIGKEGAFHRKLRHNNVITVQEFVRMLMVKPDELRAILGEGMTDRMWEATTNHARTCEPDDKVYVYAAPHGTIYVNSVFKLVRVEIGGVEWPLQQLRGHAQMIVEQLMLEAYEQRHSLQEAQAFMLHGHAANNVPLLQNAAHVAVPAPAETPLWYPNAPEIEFPAPVVDNVVSIPQANSFGYQWPGQVFHMPG